MPCLRETGEPEESIQESAGLPGEESVKGNNKMAGVDDLSISAGFVLLPSKL